MIKERLKRLMWEATCTVIRLLTKNNYQKLYQEIGRSYFPQPNPTRVRVRNHNQGDNMTDREEIYPFG